MRILASSVMILILIFQINTLLAQGKPYEGPNDPAGDKAAEREAYMDGNRVFLYFQNTTELGKWIAGVGEPLWSRWPNNTDGQRMLDGAAFMIGAQVFIDPDGVPVTSLAEIETRNDLDTLHFLQTSYREEMDTDPTGTIEWGFYPVFGYFNEAYDSPAMSNDPASWPPDGWPAVGNTLKWPGEWNGKFGRGISYADLETYYVVNDAQDQEYLGFEDQVKYYPRPGVFIGDQRPEVTIQKGSPWGGIGTRVEVRGFQWSNVEARDILFWEYKIANISDYDLPKLAIGFWVDNGIGGESSDEIGFFNRQIDMVYSWDIDGVGRGGGQTGIMGFAYLETPSRSFDGIDNDEDGLVDENRGNLATTFVGPTDGISDIDKFLQTYNLKFEDLHDHWDADEDQDWQDGNDANGNNTYAYFNEATNSWIPENGEYAGDDVGIDGIGPGAINYNGPDNDGSEGNGKPDYVQGIGSEPNFASTDISEGDMIGLTSFRLFPVPSHSFDYRWLRGDESMWDLIGEDSTLEFLGNISNLIMTFAAGPFSLYQGREDRVSIAELHAYDELAGLNSSEYTAPALFTQKHRAQVIYEKDYRFSTPPLMPKLSAYMGNKKVVLSWDDLAETKTRDPLINNINDFEGYKLYKATTYNFEDAPPLYDGFGNRIGSLPIFQCDLIDNISGFANYGLINGAAFYLGEDSGIRNYYVDEDIEEGKTYYYALVAYDFGNEEINLRPIENTFQIFIDEDSSIVYISENVQIINQSISGNDYTLDVDAISEPIGTAEISLNIGDLNSIKKDREYLLMFDVDTLEADSRNPYHLIYVNNGYKIVDKVNNSFIVYQEDPSNYIFQNLIATNVEDHGNIYRFNPNGIASNLFDGIQMSIPNPVDFAEYDPDNSGWKAGSGQINVDLNNDEIPPFPWQYEINFTNDDSVFVSKATGSRFYDQYGKRFRSSEILLNQAYSFYVTNKSFRDSVGDYPKLEMIVHDQNLNGIYDQNEDRILVGFINTEDQVNPSTRWVAAAFSIDFKNISESDFPVSGDTYRINYIRPFLSTDSIEFIADPKLVSTLDNQEPLLVNQFHLYQNYPNPFNPITNIKFSIPSPSDLKLSIYNVMGQLVRELVNEYKTVGHHTVKWDGLNDKGLKVSSGIYFYNIQTSSFTKTKKMILLK